jgi:aminoglycoside phosphotransferase (APT) family kinase protein
MFDPNQDRLSCETYLSSSLGCRVEFVRAIQLTQSTRTAPWRLEVIVNGVRQSYVLQLDARNMDQEFRVLKAMQATAIPTPQVYGLDLMGEFLGVPCFFSDFIEGEPLLAPMLADENWAEQLYIDSVCNLQAVTAKELGEVGLVLEQETAEDVLEEAYTHLKSRSLPLVEAAYRALKDNIPELPLERFSNGDLWLENFIVQNRKLAGVIDFPGAMFSDPVYEFLLSFFITPALQGRGIEARFCRQIGVDPSILDWYHGLEYFETLRWVLETGQAFVQHGAESLQADLQKWLDEFDID